MKIKVEALVKSTPEKVWMRWNNPDDIMVWNTASDDWHTTSSSVDLRVGGRMNSRMEAKDGSTGFDFAAEYTKIVPHRLIEFILDDGRKVLVEFTKDEGGVRVRETFDADNEYDPEMQRQGWQAILDNFARYVESAE